MKSIIKALFALSIIIFASCSKSERVIESENEIQELTLEERMLAIPNNTFEGSKLITLYGETMKEVLTMAKDPKFRTLVYETASLHDDQGQDYDITFNEVIKSSYNKTKHQKSLNKLSILADEIKAVAPSEDPIVFFPKAETIKDHVKANKNFDVKKALNVPVAVMKGAYNDDYSAPGFKLNAKGELEYIGDIDEEYAWENDVYVIGPAENADAGLNISFPDDFDGILPPFIPTSKNRQLNRAEYGGEIRIVSNLNQVEHWFSGKLEFTLVVAGIKNSTATITNELKYPKVKREKFKDQKWYNFNSFLFNWNIPIFGDYNIEKWIERDGGLKEELSITIPSTPAKPAKGDVPAQPPYPGGTVKFPSKDLDDDLGRSIVQFSDKIDQIYNLGKVDFRRKPQKFTKN